MSVLTTPPRRQRRPQARPRPRRGAPSQAGPREHGHLTLEDLVTETWAGVDARGQATCPICSGERLQSSGCPDCGAHLS